MSAAVTPPHVIIFVEAQLQRSHPGRWVCAAATQGHVVAAPPFSQRRREALVRCQARDSATESLGNVHSEGARALCEETADAEGTLWRRHNKSVEITQQLGL